jgi:zinc carboxypeptidase/carboxypeptidase M14-like protein
LRSILAALVFGAVVTMPAAIVFDSSFECGNGTNFTLVGPNEHSFELEPDTGSTDRQWFYFSVAGAQGQTLTFNLLDTDLTNVPSHWSLAWPVASSDAGATWSLTTGTPSHASDTFTFSHLIGADPELIAFHYPHTLTRAQAMIASWETHADVTRSVIGASTQGRDIDLLTVTDATSNPPGGKLGFWIVARQHAAEVTGSWMVEGFMEFLLSSDPRAVGLRELAVIQVVPMMNPDGVFAGNYRDNALGFNLNREWDTPSSLDSPEVLAVTDEIADWVGGGNSYDFFADLHSTSGGTVNFAFHSALSVEPPLHTDPPDYSDQLDILLGLIESEDPDFDADTGNSTSLDQRLSRQRQMRQYGVLAVLFEGTYNFTSYGPNTGQRMTPDRHRAIGEAFAIALQQYFLPSVPAELAVFGAN